MAETSIQWTDRVWNPVTGCTKISAGCKNCYAERIANRHLPGGGFTDRPFTTVRCHPERLDQPLHWRKPSRIFVNSMSDLFHDDVPDAFIIDVCEAMRKCPQHTFQILTKRPERMSHFGIFSDYTMAHVWLGVSVENEEQAKLRIPHLCATRTLGVRFLSVEPMLGPIDLYLKTPCSGAGNLLGCIGWVICGGESGPGARHFDPEWAMSIQRQCGFNGIPFFMKQMGTDRSRWKDGKGGDMNEWPGDLRVREFPR